MNLPPSQLETLIQNLRVTGQQAFDLADKLQEEQADSEKEEYIQEVVK